MSWRLLALSAALMWHASAVAATPPVSANHLAAGRAALRGRALTQALVELGTAANSGSAEAQYLLGQMHLNGVGTPINAMLARSWLEKAAQQKHPAAAYVLAALLAREPVEREASQRWLQRSAELGYARAVAARKDPRPLLATVRSTAGSNELRQELALYASGRNDVGLLEELGAAAANARDSFGRSALAVAVAVNGASAADWLLAHGAAVNSADRFMTTAIMLAAGATDSSSLNLLIRAGADVNALDAAGRSALFYAARANRVAAVGELAAAGAVLTNLDAHGYSAADVAAAAGAEAAMRELSGLGLMPTITLAPRSVTGKFDPDRPGEMYRGWSPLALAAARADVEEFRRLLAAGQSISERTPQGDTLLHVALQAEALESLQPLLALGASAAATDLRGKSVLALAAARRDSSALRLLLSPRPGTRVALIRPGLDQALLAAVAARLPDNAGLLLSAGAAVDAAGLAGVTALMSTAASGDVEMSGVLLRHGASVSARDQVGRTALWYAARSGRSEVLSALLAARADVSQADHDGQTPLMAAIQSGNAAAVQILLDAQARTDSADQSRDTALGIAAAAGKPELVSLLLRAGAPVNAQNERGDTPLIIAGRAGDAVTCRALLAAGANRTLRNQVSAAAADVARQRGFAALADELQRG
jgi:ankyrin repeat protein